MNFPEKLTTFLNEQIYDSGNDVHAINDDQCDGFTWIIIPKGLTNWIVLVQWYEGSDDFEIINLQGRTLEYVADLVK